MPIKIAKIFLTILVFAAVIVLHQIESIAEANSIAPPPAGWQNINGDRVVLALPNSYQGGKPSLVLDRLESILASVNPNAEGRLDLVRQNKDYIVLLAIDPDNAFPTIDNVSVTFTKATKDLTFGKYLEKTRSQLASKYQIEESNILVSPDEILKRIIARTTVGKERIVQAIYFLEEDSRYWSITYSTTANLLGEKLSTFDRSAATLQFRQKISNS